MNLQLGAAFVYYVGFMVYEVKGFDIVLGTRWMHDINRHSHIHHDSHIMWIAHKLWELSEESRPQYMPGLPPLDLYKEIVG